MYEVRENATLALVAIVDESGLYDYTTDDETYIVSKIDD